MTTSAILALDADQYGRPRFTVSGRYAKAETMTFGVNADNPDHEWVLSLRTTDYGRRCVSERTRPMTGEVYVPARGVERRAELDADVRRSARRAKRPPTTSPDRSAAGPSRQRG